MNPLFVRDNEYYIPTESAASVWGPVTIHGGASTALMVSQMEEQFSDTDMQLARLTVDLFRPVPREPLQVRCKTIRNGKRIKLFEASIYHRQQEISRSTGLVLKKHSIEVPNHATAYSGLPAYIANAMGGKPVTGILSQTKDAKEKQGDGRPASGLHALIQLKPVSIDIGRGHGCAWLKLPVDVLEGRKNSSLLNVVALADFANGLAQLQLNEELGFINADVTINLHRMPESEWLCLDAKTIAPAVGIAMVETVLYDELGPIGRISQSNLTMKRLKQG